VFLTKRQLSRTHAFLSKAPCLRDDRLKFPPPVYIHRFRCWRLTDLPLGSDSLTTDALLDRIMTFDVDKISHPLAAAFPLIEGPEFDELVADVREHGLRDPIVLYEGLILDGRNRRRACEVAGVEPRFEEYVGDDPRAFVISRNLKRRHLNSSQRAMIAASLADMPAHRPSAKSASLRTSHADAAKLLNVSTRTVEKASKVQSDGISDLQQAVERGSVSVSAAADVATLPKEEQQQIAAQGAQEIVAAAKRIRNNRAQDSEDLNHFLYTPAQYLELVRTVLGGIDLDPISCDVTQETVQADRYFTEEDDCLSKEWRGRVWLNLASGHPQTAEFVEKLVSEYWAGGLTDAIMLTHNYTDTDWFHQATDAAEAICFTKGRVKLVESDDETCALPRCGQCFLYFGNDPIGFARQFSKLGTILVPSRHLGSLPKAPVLSAQSSRPT